MTFDCDAEIREVLRLYHEHAAKLLAISVADFDNFPDGVLNEIRAALTHMARAVHAVDLTDEQRFAEIHDAKGHLNRVSLDAIKIMVVERMDAIKLTKRAVERIHPLSSEEYSRLRELNARRRDIVLRELRQSDGSQIVADFIQLFEDLTILEADIMSNSNHPQVRAVATRLRREQSLNFHWGWILCAVGVIASYLLGAWGPPLPSPFGHQAKPAIPGDGTTTARSEASTPTPTTP